MSGKEMRLILRKSHILCGAADSFRTLEFDIFIGTLEQDCGIYRPNGKPIYFLKLGDRLDDDATSVPKEMCSVGGVLQKMPVIGTHLPNIRTKVSRRLATSLKEASTDLASKMSTPEKECTHNKNDKGSVSIYINDLT